MYKFAVYRTDETLYKLLTICEYFKYRCKDSEGLPPSSTNKMSIIERKYIKISHNYNTIYENI
jgi:hypothetical protein